MIPAFTTAGALPAGIHESDWAEVAAHFGTSAGRQLLQAGMRNALRDLAHAGCTRVYLGGSFVTAKAEPGDWDGCFEWAGMNSLRMAKVIARGDRGMMNALFSGEIYPADDLAVTGETFIEFFQHARSGVGIGIVALDPGTAR